MKSDFLVAGRSVGPGHPPYRIADAAAEHDGDVQLGYKLIETAGATGADAIVFDGPRPRGQLSERDFKSLLGHAQYVGLTAFGTAANEEQVAFLASLDVPAFVLARADSAALLQAAATVGKPLFILGAGKTTDPEAIERLCALVGNPGAAILHRGDHDSLLETDGHVIMTRHTLRRARPSMAAGATRKGKQRT
jgi:N-acetylneuraminate synthase